MLDRVGLRPVPGTVWPMNVSLTNDLRDFVRQKVTSGEFPSEEAVLQEAVRRFRQEDQVVSCRRRRESHDGGPHRLRGHRILRP